MMEQLTGFRWQDGLDIFLLAVVLYSGLNLIRGTRAVPMLIGLGMVYGIYFLSGQLEIYTIHVLLQNLLGWSLVLVFIVFQNDIRRALTQVGTGPLFSPRARHPTTCTKLPAGSSPEPSFRVIRTAATAPAVSSRVPAGNPFARRMWETMSA